MSQEFDKKKKKMNDVSFLILPQIKNQESSVSFLQSNQDLQIIDNILKEIQSKEQQYKPTSINRQISTGLIVDWKIYENTNVKGHLIVKDGEDTEKTIFSYLILSQHSNGQPKMVIYRWIKRFPKRQSEVYLYEQEHIYRGPMKNKKKHGQAQYILLRRYSDNKKYQQLIKGVWNQDILIKGRMVDNAGNDKSILYSSLSLKSKRQIGMVEQNKQIRLETHKLSSKFMINSNKIGDIQLQAAERIMKLIDNKKDPSNDS